MSFKSGLENDLNGFFNEEEFAKEVVFISSGSGTMNIKVVVEFLEELELDGTGNHSSAILYMKKTDLNPLYMDKVWIDGIEWKVERISNYDDYIVKIFIRRREAVHV
jgi:hypothetical protein